MTTILLVALAGLLLFIAWDRDGFWGRIAGPAPARNYDFAAAPRSSTGNDALACTPGICGGTPDMELPVFDGTPESLIARLDARFRQSAEFTARLDDRADPASARYLFHSPLIRFPDIIHVQATTLPGGSTGLAAYARARLGKLDFGANRKRLARLLEGL